MTSITDRSPRLIARLTGIFFLITMILGIFAQMYVSAKIIADGDATATATNIRAHYTLFQAGFAIYLIEMGCNVVMTGLFYELLKPVSRSGSLIAAFLGLVACTIKTMSRLFFIAPLLILKGSQYLVVFDQKQLEALALLSFRVNDRGAAMAMVFFGFGTFVQGCLILRSTFLPRALGVMAVAGGLGWTTLLYAPLGNAAFPFVGLIALIGSVATIGWLLVAGVDEKRWHEQAAGIRRERTEKPSALPASDQSLRTVAQ